MRTDGNAKLQAFFSKCECQVTTTSHYICLMKQSIQNKNILLKYIAIWQSCIAKYLLKIWHSFITIYSFCMSYQSSYSKQEYYDYVLSQFGNHVCIAKYSLEFWRSYIAVSL
jgi:hypothetical protein